MRAWSVQGIVHTSGRAPFSQCAGGDTKTLRSKLRPDLSGQGHRATPELVAVPAPMFRAAPLGSAALAVGVAPAHLESPSTRSGVHAQIAQTIAATKPKPSWSHAEIAKAGIDANRQ
jgi:hypothetical protein